MSALGLDDEMLAAAQATRLRSVVSGLLSKPQVERLLALWRECQDSQAHCSVPGFVDRVAVELQLDARSAAQLRVKLFAEVLARRPVVQRARLGQPAAGPAVAEPPRPRPDPAGQVFLAVLENLDALTRNRHPERWKPLCAALVRQLRPRPLRGFQVIPLLRGEAPPAALAAPVGQEADRQALIHHYYLALCEVLGPMPADRLLSEAVKQAEQLPAAAQYAPRRLL